MQVLITGGSGTIATEIKEYFMQQQDCDVANPSRQQLDINQPQQVTKYLQQFSCIDLLICNAAIRKDNLLFKMTNQDWEETWQTNFQSTQYCAATYLRQCQQQKHGHIIFLNSYSAYHPHIGQASYTTSKAALIGYAKQLAKQWGSHNIRVNTVLPGWIPTQFNRDINEVISQKVKQSHCLQRFNTTTVTAKFIYHLHHSLPHTSGQVFNLDSRIIS